MCVCVCVYVFIKLTKKLHFSVSIVSSSQKRGMEVYMNINALNSIWRRS